MVGVELVTLAAVLQYMVFGILVGRARTRYGVKAPAVTGHEVFERTYRVQMNTLELLVGFLPVLWLAGQHWSATYAAWLGVVYLIGRTVYAVSYIRNPASRTLGFVLTVTPIGVLLLAALSQLLPLAWH